MTTASTASTASPKLCDLKSAARRLRPLLWIGKSGVTSEFQAYGLAACIPAAASTRRISPAIPTRAVQDQGLDGTGAGGGAAASGGSG